MTERGARGAHYTLVTPANYFPCRLPDLPGASVVKLVTPRLAPARFAQYLVSWPSADRATAVSVEAGFETFLYGLAGGTTVETAGLEIELGPGAYAYLPDDAEFALRPSAGSRLLSLKRRYEPFAGTDAPPLVFGHRDDEPFASTAVPGFTRRELIDPADPRFDFNMSLLAFGPGIGLGNVEIHDEEHGLYMTAGGGAYLLDRETHAVRADDFIYMAPYCPQGFVADAEQGAEYLLYKDVYRDGF